MNRPDRAVESESMQHYVVQPGGRLAGTLRVPGDKSVSHRAALLGAVAEGTSEIRGFLRSEDCLATLEAVRALGIEVEDDGERLRVHGRGLRGLRAPSRPLDLGNSGTAIRLLAGLLSGQPFDSELTGDASLCRRPMGRVAEPLNLMGARIETRDGCPPLQIRGGSTLRGIDYRLPVVSAQVKSALLLAGLYAQGATVVRGGGGSRDHTERMLAAMGADLEEEAEAVRLAPGAALQPVSLMVPGDLSSATFFLLGAILAADGEMLLTDVGINPTRDGVLEILRLMGAQIEVENRRLEGQEPVADLRVRRSALRGIDVPVELVPLAIDEFPALFIAAAAAEGVTRIRGASELRYKESDRIGVMARGLAALGAHVKEQPDGITIEGGSLHGGEIDSAGDHRVAMSFAIAALVADGELRVRDTGNVATSFPEFPSLARRAGLSLAVRGE